MNCKGTGWTPVRQLPRERARVHQEIERQKEELARKARKRGYAFSFEPHFGNEASSSPLKGEGFSSIHPDEFEMKPLDEAVAQRIAARLQEEMTAKVAADELNSLK